MTCDKYLDTRYKSLMDTWGKRVENIMTLGSNTAPADDYFSCPYKYKYFIENCDLQFDYFVLCDDDTYVNTRKFESSFNGHNKPVIIGDYVEYKKDRIESIAGFKFSGNIPSPRGGGGIVKNRQAIIILREYFKSIGSENVPMTRNSDSSIGVWAYYNSSISLENNKLMKRRYLDDVENYLTIHYVTPENFYVLDKRLGY